MSREMVNSGIPWIGDIPKGWTVARLKNVKADIPYAIVDGPFGSAISTNDYRDSGVPLVRIVNLSGKYVDASSTVYISENLAETVKRSSFRIGDIIVAKTGATVGKCAINNSITYGILSSSCVKVSISNEYDTMYYYYLFQTNEFNNALREASGGSTRDTINLTPFNNLYCLIPSLLEQQKIASFLDRKCSEIDEMITLQEKVVEELKAYKQSVITEAVTKGLNPDAPMKDSGIEWIGEIPEHWEVVRLKGVATVQRGGSPRPIEEYLSDEGYNWIKIGDTTKGDKYIRSVKQKIKEEGVSKSRKVYKGDLILTNSMSFGEPYILQVDGCIHDGWVAFSNISRVDKEFLYYFFFSSLCKLQFNLQVAGGVVQNLNVDKISSTQIVLPLETEQRAIVDYLDTKCTEIDNLISIKLSKIDSLKEYKKSIIYEYVTGKKEVTE